MPAIPSHLLLPRNGGSDSIRSTVSLGFSAPFPVGAVVCVGDDSVLRQYGLGHPNDPIVGIVEKLHPPMNTEVDVVISGVVNLETLEAGKTYYLADDGTLSKSGILPIVQGIAKGRGIFTRPRVGADTRAGAPTGAMMPIWSNEIPVGWWECDGSLMSSLTCPMLFTATMGAHGSLQVKSVGGSESVLVLAFDGKIPQGTELLLASHGKVTVLSCIQGILTLASEKPFSLLQTAPNSLHELTPLNPNEFFLPVRKEPPFKWIVKL